jgi:hypothetical protein
VANYTAACRSTASCRASLSGSGCAIFLKWSLFVDDNVFVLDVNLRVFNFKPLCSARHLEINATWTFSAHVPTAT